MRKIFTLFALCCMTLAAQAVVVNGINYEFSGSEATVSATDQAGLYEGNLIIPATVEYSSTTYDVTAIEMYAFYQKTGLTSVSIPNSVTSIGENAFEESGIQSVTLPTNAGFTRLEDNLFLNCTSLQSIEVPANVNYIDPSCFEGCTALETVTLHEGLTKISNYAFYNCSSLVSLNIPASIEDIEWYYPIFGGCTSLTAFTVADGNSYYSAEDGVLYDNYKENLFFYPAGKTGTFIVPNTVTYISDNAFNDCIGLTTLTIPASVTSMGAVATKSGLTEIIVDGGNADYTAVDGVLFSKDMTKLLCYPSAKPGSTYTIPATVTSINEFAFRNTALYNDANNWENGVMYIDNCIVATKRDLVPAALNIKDGTRLIPDNAFYGCSITGVDIPASVKGIGAYAFAYCGDLENISIASGIEYIGADAFLDTKFYNTDANWDATGTLYLGEYLIRFHNDVASDAYVVKDGTTLIASYAFYYNNQLTGTVTLPGSIRYINDHNFRYAAFSNFKILTSIPPVLQLSSLEPLMAYTDKSEIKLQVPCLDAYTAASVWSAFTNNEELGYADLLTVTSNDNAMGSATVTQEPDCSDPTAELTAAANSGYKFVKWSDDNTENPRTLTLTGELTISAVFSTATALDETATDASATKRLVNGQLFIEREGKTFNAQGVQVQ